MYQGKTLGVVVPAYNEQELIGETLASIPDFVDRIYVVDDGSTDDTPRIIVSLNHSRVHFIRHERNLGVGAAIVTGYQQALKDRVDMAVVMAGDNQMDPALLPELLEPLVRGKADYTKGDRLSQRQNRRGITRWRLFGSWLLTWLTRIATGRWGLSDPQNGYTAITRQTLEELNLDEIYPWYGYCNDLLIKLSAMGKRLRDVPMPLRYGRERSKIRYSRYIMRVSPLLLRGFLWRLKTRYWHLGGLGLDFTLDKYQTLARRLLELGYQPRTVRAYLEGTTPAGRLLVLRHDVDRQPQKALRMARLEHRLGIKATYYFRYGRNGLPSEAIKEIARLGHEVGYHYEVVDKARGDMTRAAEIFARELAELRKLCPVKTICMHGNVRTPWDNRGLWQNHDWARFDLLGEAYLSLKGLPYFSDSGRTWRQSLKVKDHLPGSPPLPEVDSTDDLLAVLKRGDLDKLYLLVHPNWWSAQAADWFQEEVKGVVRAGLRSLS